MKDSSEAVCYNIAHKTLERLSTASQQEERGGAP